MIFYCFISVCIFSDALFLSLDSVAKAADGSVLVPTETAARFQLDVTEFEALFTAVVMQTETQLKMTQIAESQAKLVIPECKNLSITMVLIK